MSDYRNPNDPMWQGGEYEPTGRSYGAGWGWLAGAVVVVILIAIVFGAGHGPTGRLSASRETLQAEEMQAEITQAALPGCVPIAETKHREVVDVTGTLRTVTLRPRGPSLTMEADLWDGTGNITLVWLGRRDIPGIEPGRRILVHGRLTDIKGEATIFNPQYELRAPGGDKS